MGLVPRAGIYMRLRTDRVWSRLRGHDDTGNLQLSPALLGANQSFRGHACVACPQRGIGPRSQSNLHLEGTSGGTAPWSRTVSFCFQKFRQNIRRFLWPLAPAFLPRKCSVTPRSVTTPNSSPATTLILPLTPASRSNNLCTASSPKHHSPATNAHPTSHTSITLQQPLHGFLSQAS